MTPPLDQERSPEETIREALTLRFDWKLNLEAKEALAVLGRQLAEKDEALREALRLRNEAYVSTPVRDDTRNAHFALQALGQILREALRAEPAKAEA